MKKRFYLHLRNTIPARRTRGFTLIELLAVIGIMVLVSAAMLANTNKFGGATMLQNLAYDVALSIRQAQVYGLSVKNVGSSLDITPGYGMYFDMGNPTQYIMFADTKDASGDPTPDGVYESGEAATTPFQIGKGYSINKLCVTDSAGNEDCSQTKLTILFVHPEPDAWINPVYNGNPGCAVDADSSEKCSSPYSLARIELISPRGDLRSVLIYNNGQISVAPTD